ncbi:MAG: hypothetical protein LUD74_00200 [Tannerellaceae bacterium]|nr:hypothetical protein [Tannerellaceae bacterium]
MKYRFTLYFLLFIIAFSSCAPINRATRLKKTPREHSLNYCLSETKAPYTDYNKEVWTVFSDRDENDTYQNPGGKVKLKKWSSWNLFFVIKEKGDYLRLVKFDPEIIENNIYAAKIKDRKKAQYYGWVHRSRLLLTRQSSTDIATRFKNKAITIATDTTAIVDSEAFFETDSIWTYRDENLTVRYQKIPMYELVFQLKMSNDKKKVLIAKKTIVAPEEAHEDILGWVSVSLVKEFTQRLFVDMKTIPAEVATDSFLYKDRAKMKPLDIPAITWSEISSFQKRTPSFRYNPVQQYCTGDSMDIRFRTAVPAPVVDRKDNYVYNVNGKKIMYGRFLQLEKELKKLNLMFVFEGKEQVLNNFSELLNIVQNLHPVINKEEDGFEFRYGAVMACRNKKGNQEPVIRTVGLTASYDEMIEFLTETNEQLDNYQPLTIRQAWTGLRTAVDLLEGQGEETNIVVILGEEGYSEWADSVLVHRMADANCRILGYQMNSEVSNRGNNFVLQIENMIAHAARRESHAKREKIVFTDQVKPYQRYKENSRNVYSLDFPQRSMTQGWVLFPDKANEMPLDMLFTAIDTLVMQVKADNDTLISSLDRAFRLVGSNRYKYDTTWVNYNLQDSTWLLDRGLPGRFKKELPAWYLPSQTITLEPTDTDVNYHLLLSQTELNSLVQFMEIISAREPDYKYKGKKQRTRKFCNCPDDELYFQAINMDYYTDKEGLPVYMTTKRIRKHLYRLYLNEMRSERLCTVKTKKLKRYSLAKMHYEILGSPTDYPIATGFTLKDIKRKKHMRDFELDEMIQYFKTKKDALADHIRTSSGKDTFVSNGETYYWIDSRLLP